MGHPETQLIIKGSTDPIETYPPVLVPVTGTPTARVGTNSVALPDAAENATADTTSATTNAAATQGARTIVVSSGTAVVKGRRYLLTDATTGRTIVVTVGKTGTLTTIPLETPLPMPFASGSTLSGWRITYSLSALQTATTGRGIVEWTATIGGVTKKWPGDFRIVERSGIYTLTGEELVRESPYSAKRRDGADDDYSRAIQAAWTRYVQPALLKAGLRPERIFSWSDFNHVHIAAVELHLAKTYDNDADVRAEKQSDFTTAFDSALASHTLWVTSDAEEEDPSPPPPGADPEFATIVVHR